jgi:hypothetical protein
MASAVRPPILTAGNPRTRPTTTALTTTASRAVKDARSSWCNNLSIASPRAASALNTANCSSGALSSGPGTGEESLFEKAHTDETEIGPTVLAFSPPRAVDIDVVPDSGYVIAGIGGSCGGALVATTYTTQPVVQDCTVNASFALTPGAGGAIAAPTLSEWSLLLLAFAAAALGAAHMRSERRQPHGDRGTGGR